MSIQSIARWQWLLIGMAIGLPLWAAQRHDAGDLPVTGECLNDQSAFERRLLTNLGGQPMFKNVRASRQVFVVPGAQPRTVYVVTGKSCDGVVQPDGNFHWIPAFFVAPVPYQPAMNLRALQTPARPDVAAYWRQIQEPTVVDFLKLAHDARGVRFTNAWWVTYPFAAWFGGAVLMIGIVWPCVIDLLAHGRLVRPRPARGVSLLGVQAHAPATDAGGGENPTQAPDPSGSRKFQAKPEDYYPTEDRAASHQ
ncbi:MAG TPA: hypothetical protein VH370_08645 [Humisphaera sp.]|jgi:hypothetical protein|nr:hypothetical protein [Humisphaera sp.]